MVVARTKSMYLCMYVQIFFNVSIRASGKTCFRPGLQKNSKVKVREKS